MAYKTIGQLDAAASAESADLIEIEQFGVSKYASIDQILNNEGRLMSASGIKFPTAQVPSADANTLDDYEEGTWTPAYNSSAGALGAVTYQVEGRYTKVGQVVHVTFFIRTNALAVGTASGILRIINLPFVSGATLSVGVCIGYAITFAGEVPISGRIVESTNRIELAYRSSVTGNTELSAPSDLTTGSVANANYLVGFVTYTV